MECSHTIKARNGKYRDGRQRWRCTECGVTTIEPKPRRVCPCDLCDGEAIRLFLCGECWRRVPSELVAAWLAVGAMGKGRVKGREKFCAAQAIIAWASRQSREANAK